MLHIPQVSLETVSPHLFLCYFTLLSYKTENRAGLAVI